MGTVIGFICDKCGFEFEIGETQPYYTFSGEIVDKYCPHVEQIISVFTPHGREVRIRCEDEDWQEEFGDPEHCKKCDRSCLKSLDSARTLTTCPRCGKEFGEKRFISICEVD